MGLIKNIFKKKNEEISVLDFGSGWGFWLSYLKKNNFDTYAFEVSETRINFLKKNQIKVISDIVDINNRFDFIYSEETFEHISNPKETLINLSKILKEDGIRFSKNNNDAFEAHLKSGNYHFEIKVK